MPKKQLVGVDVSAKTLNVSLESPEGSLQRLEVANNSAGHRQFVRRLTRAGRGARVSLEGTGIYSLDLALALYRAPCIEVAVLNPRAVRDFARAWLKRSKTDLLDADILLEFTRRMPFKPWQPPEPAVLSLRAIARRIGALTRAVTQEGNRCHAAAYYQQAAKVVQHDIDVHRRFLKRRIQHLRDKALDAIWQHPRLRKDLAHLTSIKGIAKASAIQILAELSILPQEMTPRQWVAHAGLDPRIVTSGTSLHKPGRISRIGNRHLRAALYMPALVAARREPHVRAFYEKLIARGKTPMQAIVAVMRKLLHAIHGMLRHGSDFVGEKFYNLEAEKA